MNAQEQQDEGFISQEECLNNTTSIPSPHNGESHDEAGVKVPTEIVQKDEALSIQGGDALTASVGGRDERFQKIWNLRGGQAYGETKTEWQIFRYYCLNGRGRSLSHIAQVFSKRTATVKALAEKNNWEIRAQQYDNYMLAEAMLSESETRKREHIRKLEDFRAKQEFLGSAMTGAAAKLMAVAQRKLDAMLEDEETELSQEELSKIISNASRIAETGKSLSGGALGLDALLEALDSTEGENRG